MSGVDTWTVTIPGTPRPQGSAKWVVGNRTGRPVPKKDAKETAHRAAMVFALRKAYAGRAKIDGPVELSAVFAIPRPKSHHTKTGNLTASAPLLHTYKPDCDKLTRLVGDALTIAGVIADDALICSIHAEKRWLPHPVAGWTRLTLRTIDVLNDRETHA